MSDDFTKFNVGQLRNMLVSMGLTAVEAAKIKGKSNLVAEIQNRVESGGVELNDDEADEKLLDEVDLSHTVTSDVGEDREQDEQVSPAPYSPEWSDYVLSHLVDDEFALDSNGNKIPKVDGLRRVTGLLIGQIVRQRTDIKQVPDPSNDYCSSVVHMVTVVTYDGEEVTVSGAADASRQNIQKPYHKFPVSVAETRAESRALKRLLRLNVVVAEELENHDNMVNDIIPDEDGDNFGKGEIQLLSILGKRHNVDINKLILEHFEPNINLTDLSKKQGDILFEELDKFQKDGVPEELVGYSESWLTT